jgi:hypothetical protein
VIRRLIRRPAGESPNHRQGGECQTLHEFAHRSSFGDLDKIPAGGKPVNGTMLSFLPLVRSLAKEFRP